MSAAIDRLPSTTGQDDELTSETGGPSAEQDPAPSVVKTEPQSGASDPQTVSTMPSDMDPNQHDGSPSEKAEDTAIDSSLSDLPRLPGQITLDNVRTAIDTMDLAKLELYSEAVSQVLDKLRQPMADLKLLRWLKRIDKIGGKPQQIRTVVAVAGATGAGKSSLIDALLNEQRLLPTSGFRACTAVVTEISYNKSTDPKKAYRAEVEFISQEDWDSELNLLFGELVENQKLSPAYLDANVEAGIAYARIRAVYPDLTHSMIEQAKASDLAKREAVANVLGTTRKISCRNAQGLYKEIRSYLDSNDKDTKGGPQEEKDMAYWPLIKVVKVYTRASVLKEGICLVDLPGVQDANAARSAVASKYMAQASSVWVAAPIKRAVDDEAAKKLLGMGSRLQMKLDGMYSSMSFICTITDNFDVEECVEAFDGDGQIKDTLTKAEQLSETVQEMQQSLELLKQQLDDEETVLEGLESEIDVWKALQKQHNAGQQVYPPLIPAKRKRGTGRAARRRRQQVENEDSNEEEIADRSPLTASEISWKVADLDHNLQVKTSECDDMEKRLETMAGELDSLQHEKDEASIESLRLCVQKRNQHVRDIVRVDFSNGIKEIDEDDTHADEASFDPSAKQRDYDEVGRSLPVFCVSSKAYKMLRKKTKRETRFDGFRTLDDSEIPLLQQHAIKLPEQRRIHAHKTFLHEFCGLLGSLSDWASQGMSKAGVQRMSEQDEATEKAYLSIAVEDLKKDLDMLIWDQKADLENIINNELQSQSVAAIASASKRLHRIVTRWSDKTNVGGWGIAYGTYKAICRRNGSKTKNKTSRDFNEDILEPYLKKIASGWEQAFGHSIPQGLDTFSTVFCQRLRDFHAMMSSRLELRRCKMKQLHTLSRQLKNYETSMTNNIINVKVSIQAEQREASRAFYPEIKNQMLKAYTLVTNEEGAGSFARMKEHMSHHVRSRQNAIYRRASERVGQALGKNFEANREELEEEAHNIVDKLEADFRSMISGSKKNQAEETARGRTRALLHETDVEFKALASMESMNVSGDQHPESEPQQASAADMVDVSDEADEASEAGEPPETGAMDTEL
ncbi:hypothetical protein SLS64_003073 [Diaporthe eres]